MQPWWKLVMGWNKCNQKCLSRCCPASKHWPVCFNALHYWFSWGCTLQGLATKTDKNNKLKTRDWSNLSRPVLFSRVFFQSSTCEKDQKNGEKTRLGNQILFLNRKKPQVPTRQIWSSSPGMGRGLWRGLAMQLTMLWGGRGHGPAQTLPQQVPRHVLHEVRYKTEGTHPSFHPHTRKHK